MSSEVNPSPRTIAGAKEGVRRAARAIPDSSDFYPALWEDLVSASVRLVTLTGSPVSVIRQVASGNNDVFGLGGRWPRDIVRESQNALRQHPTNGVEDHEETVHTRLLRGIMATQELTAGYAPNPRKQKKNS